MAASVISPMVCLSDDQNNYEIVIDAYDIETYGKETTAEETTQIDLSDEDAYREWLSTLETDENGDYIYYFEEEFNPVINIAPPTEDDSEETSESIEADLPEESCEASDEEEAEEEEIETAEDAELSTEDITSEEAPSLEEEIKETEAEVKTEDLQTEETEAETEEIQIEEIQIEAVQTEENKAEETVTEAAPAAPQETVQSLQASVSYETLNAAAEMPSARFGRQEKLGRFRLWRRSGKGINGEKSLFYRFICKKMAH